MGKNWPSPNKVAQLQLDLAVSRVVEACQERGWL